MAWFGAIEELPREWICWAHRHEARVVFTTSIPESILRQNTTSRESWARKLVEHVTAVGGDGLNLDYESPVTQTDVSRQEAMTHITHEIQVRLKASNPHSSLVWDFGWKPNVDVRFYPYRRMADICDHVFLMVYDTQSQVWDGPPCVAGPNAPKVNVEKTLRWYGVGDHDKTRNEDTTQVADSLNIPYEKIILGLPWYGYYYHCTEYDPVTERCTIPTVPFRGAPCSDAAGKQIDYPFTMDALKQGNAQGIFDPITLSMKAFVTNVTTGNTTAYFYDSPETIRDKIRYAWEFTQGQLGGVGMWNVDVPDYTNKDQAKAFWQAMVVPPAPVSPGKIGDAVILGAIS
jgi:di-N-acetylchitobiase